MTVAQIAYDNLPPAKQKRANELVALIEYTGQDYEFVTSACWMDDIRDLPMFEPLKDFHFITQMNIIDNAVPVKPPPPVNVVEVIRFLVDKLSSSKESDLKKAYYLAELAHLVGDIHQPLHCSTRFTNDDPSGDLGGNYFMLSEDSPRKNLHSYWDAAGGIFSFRDVGRPLTDNRRKSLLSYTEKITTSFPKNNLSNEINNLNPEDWAKEGFKIAVDEVYTKIKEGDVPNKVKLNDTTTYEENVRKISGRRIALAGYRLASILDKIL